MFNKIFFKLWPKSIFLQKMDLTRVRQLYKADYQCEWNYYKNIHKKQKKMSTSQCFVNPWTTIDFHVSGFRENLIGILQDSCTFKKNSDKFHHTRPYFLSNSCPLNKYLRIVILKRIGKSEIKNWFHIIINKDNYGMYFAIKGQTLQQD